MFAVLFSLRWIWVPISNIKEGKGIGGNIERLEATEFKRFIEDMELIDPPLLGRKFVWYKIDGSAMSRLDRFLLSDEWIQQWEVEAQWVINRDVSDHCLITLKNGFQEWGPKPFLFSNCWLAHPGLKSVVVRCWQESNVQEWKAFILKEKLKRLKIGLKI